MPRRPEPRHLTTLAAALSVAWLGGCSLWSSRPAGDDEPTLRSLAERTPPAIQTGKLRSTEDQALAAWRALLAAQPDPRQRAQALRRLGDLEMDRSDSALAADTGASAPQANHREAIASYQAYLTAYPQAPDNDRVLYQLARAHELDGEPEAALATLDRLVASYPTTPYLDEVQFRRGELLFTARQYPAAEQAYSAVLARPEPTVFHDRALYMQGWSRFKQGQLDGALEAFLGVLDGKLADQDPAVPLEQLDSLSRADRELLDDSFRVVSLTLENLQGAASIPPVTASPARQHYQVRLYRHLAALYLQQDRPKDAADTLLAFTRLRPEDAQAPALQNEVIGIYAQAGFAQQAQQVKVDFVTRYGAHGPYRQANPGAWQDAQPQVREHLAELARQAHAQAQQSHAPADVAQAVQWYRTLLTDFPDHPETAENRFLMAELLFEARRFDEAALAYEQTAYPAQDAIARSAPTRRTEAGYAAVLARAELVKAAPEVNRPALERDQVSSELRFAQAFPADSRAPAVQAHAAETLYRLGDAPGANAAALALLQRQPAAPEAQRRTALNVLAHTRFEAGAFDEAERYTREALALTPAADASRRDLTERLAASLYKQGEQARTAGDTRRAAELFTRVTTETPEASARVAAQFDAATQRLALKDWAGASQLLEDFRQRFPRDALQAQVPPKLALAYSEQGRWADAAAEAERIAQSETDPERARAARWQAAQWADQAQAAPGAPPRARAEAARSWEAYWRAHPQPLPEAVEALNHLVLLAHADGQTARERQWQRTLVQAEAAGGAARTERSRSLAALAALALADEDGEAFRAVALKEPLQKSLASKKARLETALQAYARVADYGTAEAVTAATFRTAALYQDFGRALMDSERPRKLSKLEREQYDVMLEEQAYPFEEKAIGLHEANAARAPQGLYDRWVRQSFDALRTLRPARWAKAEREAPCGAGAALTRQGLAARQDGNFVAAGQAWAQALKTDSSCAAAALNLGVLNDLYLGSPEEALRWYQQHQTQAAAQGLGADAQVGKWITEVQRRLPKPAAPAAAPSAAAEAASKAASAPAKETTP